MRRFRYFAVVPGVLAVLLTCVRLLMRTYGKKKKRAKSTSFCLVIPIVSLCPEVNGVPSREQTQVNM